MFRHCVAVLAVVASTGGAVTTAPPRSPTGPPAATVTARGPALPSQGATVHRRPVLRQGASGTDVLALQRRLSGLGYWIGRVDGRFGPLTTQAVYALQKAAGLGRDGVVGSRTWTALDRGVRPAATTVTGRRVEIDLGRQLLLLVMNGRVERVFNTSTGSGRTYTVGGTVKRAVTPRGAYTVYRQVNGWDRGPLGSLYRPRYFNGGIAVHGYGSVPPYPASHGCVRVSLDAMDWIWSSPWLKVGHTVVVR
ncbi:peptidoglycan-binding protein [Planobispora siamensis]|uniref:Peptidoglycan-binding protein n=1 Tax=Planobispora siamensis TaxID=936338 RepID=A0A8J3SPJ6_9ACTN|nr:L,D-transpeptidase family protein [Planobispora siamensis]GIH96340.1 peptidoglycan-binding protein [Planobispora siamensis]